MSNLVNIKIHGILGEQLGQSEWNLAVKSVGEAIKGIQCNSKKLYPQLLENDKKNIKYRVLINDKDFSIEEGADPNTPEGITSSELVIERDSIKTIDIVPVIEGSDNIMSIVTIIVGVALIWTGVGGAMALGGLSSMTGMQGAMVLGGIGLVAAGVTNLLTPMPKFGDFREIEQGGSRSYLFNGPQNTIKEGGPVFVGYGRLMVGSHVIQSATDTVNVNAGVAPKDTWGLTNYGLLYNIPGAEGDIRVATARWNDDPPTP